MELPPELSHWNTDEGRPYKGKLIDLEAYKKNPSIGCMCAQGQVLFKLGGWSVEKLMAAGVQLPWALRVRVPVN